MCMNRAVVVRNQQTDIDLNHRLLGTQAEDLLRILKVLLSFDIFTTTSKCLV